ncbi:MAG: hypothetical protein HQK51_17460, partial [Oligoflexia bacterium]|nr:hypothetical protein [Oligoflexia bacterium]
NVINVILEEEVDQEHDSRFFIWPQYLLLITSVILAFWVPSFLSELIKH